ncbi:hypothetical protein ABZ154_03670 [Streptomyces sp. NPDC006261]|uniref:hypothetical protein n=1 Tax=Streptomyces sp. NPDC006261 TaxID=3156739 RepID=UPI0033A56ADF
MADCIHHVAICTTCGGLEATRLDKLPGVTSLAITWGDGTTSTTSGDVFIGPAGEPCEKGTDNV